MKRLWKCIPGFLLACLLIFGMAGCRMIDTEGHDPESEPVATKETTKLPETTNAPEMTKTPDNQPEAIGPSALHNLLKSSDRIVAESETIGIIPCPDDISVTGQGGYSDGTYQYQFFIQKDTASNERDNIVRLVKYDIEKQETIAVSGELYINHANDLTYNSKTGEFIAVNCHYDGNIISIISPETLQVTRKMRIGASIYSISYNDTRDCYVVGINGGQDFYILDSNFKQIGERHSATSLTTGYVAQGVTSDDEYIYFILYDENVITVYDWDGRFVSLIYLDILGGEEPENISVIDDDIYVVSLLDGGTSIRKLTSIKKFAVSAVRTKESEPTPAAGSGRALTDFFSAERIHTYLPLDGAETDAIGKVTVSTSNRVTYCPGYYGEAAEVYDGYISIHDYTPENKSFSVSFWINTPGTNGDPAILSNKDWDSSKNPGYILALKHNSVQFAMGNKDRSASMKAWYPLPMDYHYGWMHVILSVDREAGTVSIVYDFDRRITEKIPEELKNTSLNAINVLNIGQDGTGKYNDSLPAAIDEIIIFDGALGQEDISALALYYGIKS